MLLLRPDIISEGVGLQLISRLRISIESLVDTRTVLSKALFIQITIFSTHNFAE
jgi:hypothetical protein